MDQDDYSGMTPAVVTSTLIKSWRSYYPSPKLTAIQPVAIPPFLIILQVLSQVPGYKIHEEIVSITLQLDMVRKYKVPRKTHRDVRTVTKLEMHLWFDLCMETLSGLRAGVGHTAFLVEEGTMKFWNIFPAGTAHSKPPELQPHTAQEVMPLSCHLNSTTTILSLLLQNQLELCSMPPRSFQAVLTESYKHGVAGLQPLMQVAVV